MDDLVKFQIPDTGMAVLLSPESVKVVEEMPKEAQAGFLMVLEQMAKDYAQERQPRLALWKQNRRTKIFSGLVLAGGGLNLASFAHFHGWDALAGALVCFYISGLMLGLASFRDRRPGPALPIVRVSPRAQP